MDKFIIRNNTKKKSNKEVLFERMNIISKNILNENDSNIKLNSNEKQVVDDILGDINEGIISESVVDKIKGYLKKGLITVSVIASLLSNNVQAQELKNAGVPENQIEMAKKELLSSGDLEKKLIKNLKRSGKQGVINQYNKLSKEQKQNVLNAIIDSGKDIKDIDISLYMNQSSDLSKGDEYTKIGEEKIITVDTSYVQLEKNIEANFAFNSAEVKNPQLLKKIISDTLNSFYKIDKIIIEVSSSTLRNTGDFKKMTWVEGNKARVNSIVKMINGMEYDLGGCDKNEKHKITTDIIYSNTKGENGDGTSGPKSPMEASKEGVDWYNNNDIDPKYWNSNSEEEAYYNLDDINANPDLAKKYTKHQYVKIVIKGQMVETKTNEIINYDLIKIREKQDKVKLDKIKAGGKVDVTSCPVKVKTTPNL